MTVILPPDGSIPELTDADGTAVTLGNFDGLHRGHQEVINHLVKTARKSGRPSVLVTFHPHPLKIVRPQHAPPLLTSPAEKRALLERSALDYVLILEFTPELREYPARRFVEEILIGRLRMKELVLGYDHGFGRDREGSPESMRALGDELGFEVDVVPPVSQGSDPVSSSAIRGAVRDGDMAAAARGLGRPYTLRGRVVRGKEQGRALGFPTANLEIDDPDKLMPAEGIYAVRTELDGDSLPSLLHLGPRPTFEGFEPSAEVHLLDWEGDLYGRTLTVELCSRLRGIRTFKTPEALIEQMERDAEQGRQLLTRGGGGCVPG